MTILICANVGLRVDNTGLEFTPSSALRTAVKFVGMPNVSAVLEADKDGNERALFLVWRVENPVFARGIEHQLELLAIAMNQTAISIARCDSEGNEVSGELIGINRAVWGEYESARFRWPDENLKGRAVAASLAEND